MCRRFLEYFVFVPTLICRALNLATKQAFLGFLGTAGMGSAHLTRGVLAHLAVHNKQSCSSSHLLLTLSQYNATTRS